jgi:hypothetical protein
MSKYGTVWQTDPHVLSGNRLFVRLAHHGIICKMHRHIYRTFGICTAIFGIYTGILYRLYRLVPALLVSKAGLYRYSYVYSSRSG